MIKSASLSFPSLKIERAFDNLVLWESLVYFLNSGCRDAISSIETSYCLLILDTNDKQKTFYLSFLTALLSIDLHFP